MKKMISAFMILTALLSFSFSTALADGIMVLRETRNDPNGDVIFVFDFTGDFSKFDFRGGFVYLGDQKFPLGCNIVDTGVVQCTTSRAVSGQNVQINLAGFVFWTFVPDRHQAPQGSTEYCYNVYDLYETTQGVEWEAFDVYCQTSEANYGDMLNDYPNPDYGSNDYEFTGGSSCYNVVNDDAYFAECIL